MLQKEDMTPRENEILGDIKAYLMSHFPHFPTLWFALCVSLF